MAMHFLRGESAPVILPDHFSQAAAIMARFDRAAIGNAIEVLVGLLDAIDGDPDLEGECSEDEVSRCTDDGRAIEGDGPGCEIADPSGVHDEDGQNTMFSPHRSEEGPGCSIADPGGCQHDDLEHDDAY